MKGRRGGGGARAALHFIDMRGAMAACDGTLRVSTVVAEEGGEEGFYNFFLSSR